MGRYMAIDFGRKRVGIAVSDPGKRIAQGLTTVPSGEIWNFLDEYLSREEVEVFVVGYPLQASGAQSESMQYIAPFVKKLKKRYSGLEVVYEDERFTSKMAMQAMIDGGMKKKDRRVKGNVDKISATLILQSYMMRREQVL